MRAIGLSNASEKIVEEVLKTATVAPAVDQLEIHLYNPQHKLTDYLRRKGIVVQAYSPLVQGRLDDPVLTQLAQKVRGRCALMPDGCASTDRTLQYNKDAAQIAIRWSLQHG